MSASATVVRPDGGRRTAALWVAGVGAALLVVAAGLFVAVRWNDLPAEAKLAVILGLTGAFLLAGSALKRTLPATGSVLFHLGAFLLPVDLGAINLRVGWSWEELLLAEGILGVVAFGALGVQSGSVVLKRAAAVSVAAVAVGVGATTLLAAPLALALAAAAYSVRFPRSPEAIAWAAGAGFMPVFALALDSGPGIAAPLATLGLGAAHEPIQALATGALAAFVLARSAHLGRDVGLAFVGIGALVTSSIAAWISADLPAAADTLAGPAAFLVVELICFAAERDDFWRKPARWIAGSPEVVVLSVAVAALGFVAMAPVVETGFIAGSALQPDAVDAAAFALVAVGSLVAALRLQRVTDDGILWRLASIATALFAVGTVQAGTGSSPAIATAMVAVAVALVLLRHPLTDVGAAAAALYAPVTANSYPEVAFLAAAAGAATLVWAAREGSRSGRRVSAALLSGAAVATLGLGAIFGAGVTGAPPAGLAFVAGCFIAAAIVGRADREIAAVARFGSLAVLLPALTWTPSNRLVVVLPLVALLAFDAVRTSEPRIAFGLVVPLQAAVWDIARGAGLETAHAGIVLCVAAFVWAGLAEAIGGGYREPLGWAAATGVSLGLLAASPDPTALGVALIVSGSLGLGAGLLARVAPLAHAGGALITIGAWIELATGGIHTSEAYLALPSLHLLAAGAWARRRSSGWSGATPSEEDVSSWVAYVPAVAILGGAGVMERVTGGAGWHAIVAGAIGVAAVAVGGWRRLGGPLVAGTLLLGLVVGYESLAVAATVPTWAWLALGGSALLATGIALERTDTTPVEAGRRVVEVIQHNFD